MAWPVVPIGSDDAEVVVVAVVSSREKLEEGKALHCEQPGLKQSGGGHCLLAGEEEVLGRSDVVTWVAADQAELCREVGGEPEEVSVVVML